MAPQSLSTRALIGLSDCPWPPVSSASAAHVGGNNQTLGSRYVFWLRSPPSCQLIARAASKEWVIPSRPKPGRKPKKDTSAVDSQEDVSRPGLGLYMSF